MKITLKLSRPPLPPKSPSLLIRLEKTRRRGIIETRGILENPKIPLPQPLESTWPRLKTRKKG